VRCWAERGRRFYGSGRRRGTKGKSAAASFETDVINACVVFGNASTASDGSAGPWRLHGHRHVGPGTLWHFGPAPELRRVGAVAQY